MENVKNPLLTTAQAAAYLGLKTSYLHKLMMRRAIPYYKPNNKLCFFAQADLDHWLTGNRIASQEEIEQRLNDKVQAGMINISCNTAPYFKDGKSEGNVMLVNELNNLYPQKVEFYRNDTGEKIYESKAIAVGSKIEHAALDVELPAGEYECTAYFSNLDPDSGATLGVAGAIIHITIQN